jgi:hypothetical protein
MKKLLILLLGNVLVPGSLVFLMNSMAIASRGVSVATGKAMAVR